MCVLGDGRIPSHIPSIVAGSGISGTSTAVAATVLGATTIAAQKGTGVGEGALRGGESEALRRLQVEQRTRWGGPGIRDSGGGGRRWGWQGGC